MKATDILEIVSNHPGAFCKVHFASVIPTLKSVQGITVEKRGVFIVSAGSEFRNRKDVREAIALGERGQVQSLPWGNWTQYPYIIAHKGNEYFRFYPPSNAQSVSFPFTPKVEFFANGEPITRDRAIELCGSRAKASEEKPECMVFNCSNVVSIG